MCNLNIHKHPLSAVGAVQTRIPQGKTLDAWLRENNPQYVPGDDQPVIARRNGELFLPADWMSCQIKADDCITLSPRPFGVEVMLAVAIVGALYSYTQMDMPSAASTNYHDLPEQSPTYDINAQGNTARLGQPVPVGYGQHRIYPDFAALPFRRYIDGDQYLFHVFSIGQGQNQISGAQIGNTSIDNFEGVEQQIVSPGQPVTLFSPDVYTSPEVSNIELFAPNDEEYAGWSGPIAVVPAESTLTRIELDLVAPRGLYNQDRQSGELSTVNVTVEAEYREIDDQGAAVGAWLSLGSWTLSGATVDPVRKTVGKDVADARYEVRTRRSSNSDDPDSIRLQEKVLWGDLKGLLQSDRTFDHTVWAVKVKASGQLNSQSERKFNVVRQRLLPVWTGTQWTGPQATRNPAWAFCDAIKASYGGNYTDQNLDLAEIKRLADVWDARGDHFDYQFDTKRTLWPALQMICMVGRAEPTIYAGVFSIVRDEPKALPDYAFGMADIVANSFSIQYTTQDQWGDDSVEIEYVNADTGAPETVLCALPGSTASRPLKVKLEGCTDRDQAYREGMFRAGVLRYRNRSVKFKTELDGGLPGYGNSIAVSNELADWGVSGQVLQVDTVGADQVLTLSEPVEFIDGQPHVIMIRNSESAKPQGPFSCVAGDSDHQIKIMGGSNASIYTGWRMNKSSFAFGVADQYARRFIMRGATHAGGVEFNLSGVLDDPRVHELDAQINGGFIPVPTPTDATVQDLAQVRGLRIEYTGTPSAPVLNMTWNPVEYAEQYIVQISRDGGVRWTTLATTQELWMRKLVEPGEAKIRIAAMKIAIGPWYTQNITPGQTIHQPNAPTGLALAEPWTGKTLRVAWAESKDAEKWIVNVCTPAGVPKRSVEATLPEFEYTYLDARNDGIGRDLVIKVWAIGKSGETSALPVELVCQNAQIGALANVQVESITNVAMVQADYPTDADFAGFRVWVDTAPGFVASDSNMVISQTGERLLSVPLPSDYSVRYVRIAGVDVWGDDALNVSASFAIKRQQITETEIAPHSILTPHLKANIVTAEKCLIEQLSALTADLGMVTGGTFKTSSGNGLRVEMSSQGDLVFWIGSGTKTEANALFSINQATQKLIYRGELDIQSAGSGDRMLIDNDSINVVASNGVKLVELGKLS